MTKELIERLRAMYIANGTNYVQAAADKLEAQAKYIRQLEDANTPELVALRAQLAEIAASKPVGAIYTIAGVQHCTITETLEDTELFARPMPPITAGREALANAEPTGCPTCGSECNERDELAKAERELESLDAELTGLRTALAQQGGQQSVATVGCDDYASHPNVGTVATLHTALPTGTELYTAASVNDRVRAWQLAIAELPALPEHDHFIHANDSETIECFRKDQLQAYGLQCAALARPVAPQTLSDDEILAIAHRTATRYTHAVAPGQVTYGFTVAHMIDFARAIEKARTK